MTQGHYTGRAVYILVNPDARRVKVGMTTTDVELRLRDANDKWLEHKLTCQICGTRRLAKLIGTGPRVMPKHAALGVNCPGGNSPPLEWDTALAKAHLQSMKHAVARGDKVSLTRQIRTLEERIVLRTQHPRGIGSWKIGTIYFTEHPEEVEKLTHGFMSAFLDKVSPFGEVFSCSAAEAQEAVERALQQLGLPVVARPCDK